MMKFDNIYFGKNGNIYFADKFLGTYTPARQWQIIKSLIGDEKWKIKTKKALKPFG